MNEAERRRWNDDTWVRSWPAREALTESVTPHLLEAAELRPGMRVLNIGSGGGRSCLAEAGAVAPTGTVLGVDVSAPLLALARERAADAGVANVAFALADAQADPLPGAPYDIATSQFGVMFFDDARAAFANIRAHLRPGGRLAFACWQPAERNRWHSGPVLAPFVAPPAPPTPGRVPPGPFSLGDPDRTAAVLSSAGFAGVAHRPLEVEIEAPADAVFDPGLLDYYGVAPERRAEAEAAGQRHLARFHVGGDRYRYPLAFAIWTATNP